MKVSFPSNLGLPCASLSRAIALSLITFLSQTAQGDTPDFLELSLAELSKVKVVSSTLREIDIIDAPSNVFVITKEMIDRRGYRNLVDVLQDLPGFDFGMYHESGESTTDSVVRGLGEKDGDNPKLLMLVDDVPQNNISLNATLLLSHEQQLQDVERIEVIQGPGSAIYGAQAYAGIIHIITQKKFTGSNVDVLLGEDKTREVNFHYGKAIRDDVFFSFAMKKFDTEGDDGSGRADPGGYFHGNIAPFTLTQHYDEAGSYQENVLNPRGGQSIAAGYNNRFDTISLRSKLNTRNNEVELFYWDDQHGMSSSLPGFEYYTTSSQFNAHRRGYHLYVKNNWDLTDKLSLNSMATYRATLVMPDSAFTYTYRFDGLAKSASSSSDQLFVEERLDYQYSDSGNVLLGFRSMTSSKGEYFYSLGDIQNIDSNIAESSWDIAVAGDGLFQEKAIQQIRVFENAFYGLWNQNWNEQLTSLIGIRYDESEEFGEVITPRLTGVYKPSDSWVLKLLTGSAFRQPNFSELYIEGFANNNLSPETVDTSELEVNYLVGRLHLRTNAFYSEEQDAIVLVQNSNPDPTSFTNLIFDNSSGSTLTRGISLVANYGFDNIELYSNYMFTQGKRDGDWDDIERVATHKLNAGISWLFRPHWDLNLRMNYVGERRAQTTNQWLQVYRDGYAPSYTKTNLALTNKSFKSFELQLLIMNLFDKDYYGVGRRSGDSFSDDYDPVDNVNPDGFIPPYHPQPGREIFLVLKAAI